MGQILCIGLGIVFLILFLFMGSMIYDNVGSALKTLAKIGAGLVIVASAFYGYMLAQYSVVYGVIIVIVGSICAVLGSLALYAFGQLVENTTAIRNKMNQTKTIKKEPTIDDFINNRK